MGQPLLFTPLRLRGVTSPNRCVLSPMVQHKAVNGQVNDHHLVHQGQFALGRFGIVFTENCAVEPRGRVTPGDLGIWDDSQIGGRRRRTGSHGMWCVASSLLPISNQRCDRYGGDRAGRMRLPLEVVRAVRQVMPDDKPLFVRVSALDGAGSWDLADTVAFAMELKTLGVDVVDCSSGGLTGLAIARQALSDPRWPLRAA